MTSEIQLDLMEVSFITEFGETTIQIKDLNNNYIQINHLTESDLRTLKRIIENHIAYI